MQASAINICPAEKLNGGKMQEIAQMNIDSDEDDDRLTWWQKRKLQIETNFQKVNDETSFYVHGKFKKFSKTSLGVLENKHHFRYVFVWLVTSKWFENCIISLILLNSLVLGAKDYTDYENETKINEFIEDLEPFFTSFFLAECCSKIIAQGFMFGKNAYLTEAWNWLDFSVVVTSFLQQFPSMKNMSGLRTFRLLRPLRSLTTMPSMRLLIGTLIASVSSLGSVMALALFFLLIFAILGVSIWNGRIHYRCYETEWPDANGVWELVGDDERICSGSRACPVGFCRSRLVAYNPLSIPVNPNLDVSRAKGSPLLYDSDIYNLNYGLTNFDNIFNALLTIFQCITMEGWTKIMNIYEDAANRTFVVFYYISCVVICSFFLLNLTIAVMLMKYEELDKTSKNSEHDVSLREMGRQIRGMEPKLIEFLIDQDNIQIQGEGQKLLKQEDSFFQQLLKKPKSMIDKSEKYYSYRIVQTCNDVIMNQYFDAFIIFVIILNTIALAMDMHPNFEQGVLDALSIFNYIFTVIFTAEVILKIIGLGGKLFMKDNFNKFDLLIVLISIGELQLAAQQGGDGGPGIFSSLRGFRLMKIFKLFRSGDLKILIDSIIFTLTTIGDYVILLMLFIYIFALLGMSFFAGRIKFDADDRVNPLGESPRTNFDTLHWSVITIFEVLMGEGWNDIMYQAMRSVN